VESAPGAQCEVEEEEDLFENRLVGRKTEQPYGRMARETSHRRFALCFCGFVAGRCERIRWVDEL